MKVNSLKYNAIKAPSLASLTFHGKGNTREKIIFWKISLPNPLRIGEGALLQILSG
jgi:hypothetical protein